MSQTHNSAYEFRDNFYCPGHAVWLLATVPEFTGFERSGGRLSYTSAEEEYGDDGRADVLWELPTVQAEADMDAVANYLSIDRSKAMPWEFPLLLDGPPSPPSFCSECMRWFDPLPHDRQEGML